MEEKLLEELKLILENDELNMDSQLKAEEEWDSMSMLSISAFTQDNFGTTVDNDEFKQIETVTDIVKLLQIKLGK